MDTSTTDPYLAISEHSLITELQTFIEELRTSSPQDFRAKDFQSQDSGLENSTLEINGLPLSNAFVSYDPDLHYWKTSLGSLLPPERLYTQDYYEMDERQETGNGTIQMTLKPYKLPYHPMSDEFLETWPKAGIMQGSKFYRRLKWERRINEIGSGFWRTPHASDGEGGIMEMREGADGHYKLRDHVQGKNRKYWPTARAIDGIVRHSKRWMKKRIDENRDVDLTTAVKMWPTPKALTGGPNSKRKERGSGGPDLQEKVLTSNQAHDNMGLKKSDDETKTVQNEKRPDQEMRLLWGSDEAETIWPETEDGGHGQIQVEKVLRSDVHGDGADEGQSDQENDKEALRQELKSPDTLPEMQRDSLRGGTSQRQKSRQQSDGKPDDSMRQLPHKGTLENGQETNAQDENRLSNLREKGTRTGVVPDAHTERTEIRRSASNKNQGQGRPSRNSESGADIQPTGSLNAAWVEWLMQWPIGSSSLEPMPDLLWLDWEIDPADMEEAQTIKSTPNQRDWKGKRRNNPDNVSEKGVRYGVDICMEAERLGTGTGPIPRVATGIKDRVNRLKALGNGMVPLCMATAWQILTSGWPSKD